MVKLPSRRKKQQSESDVPRKLREQVINIVFDLVNQIAPGYLPPNVIFFPGYHKEIYKVAYKYLWDELGEERLELDSYHNEIFEFLRNTSSNEFFHAVEHLLKVMSEIVHLQKTIPDDIILREDGGNELWSRKKSVRDKHINLFNAAMAKLNHRLLQNNAKYRYESGKLIPIDEGLDMSENGNDTKEPDSNRAKEHNQNQSYSESLDWKSYKIGVWGLKIGIWGLVCSFLGLLFTILGILFGPQFLITPFKGLIKLFVD